MLVLLAPILIAILAALALGGSLDHWTRMRVRWWPLAVIALIVQIPLYSPPFDSWQAVLALGAPLGVLTTALIMVVLVRNATGRTRIACALAAVGVALNLTVIVLNGGWMPRVQPLPTTAADGVTRVSNTSPVGANTRLALLGDSLEEPRWLPMTSALGIHLWRISRDYPPTS